MRIFRYFIILFLFSFLPRKDGRCQHDSLMNIWNNNKLHDTIRMNALIQKVKNDFLYINPDSTLILANELYEFAARKKSDEYAAEALNLKGINSMITGNNESALPFLEKALSKAKKTNKAKLVGRCYLNLGNYYSSGGDYGKAADNYMTALKIYEKSKNQEGMSGALNNIGLIYKEQMEYRKALKYFNKCLVIDEQSGIKYDIAISLLNIGSIYNNIGDSAVAENDFKTGIRMYDTALDFYERSLQIRKETGKKNSGLAILLNNIGTIYKNKGDDKLRNGDRINAEALYRKAETYYLESMEIRKSMNDISGISGSLNNLAIVEFSRGNLSASINYGEKALALAIESESIIAQQNSYDLLYDVYTRSGNYRKALENYVNLIKIRDSITREENQQELIRQEIKYDYEKQATADSIHNAEEKKVKDAELKQQKAVAEKQDAELASKKMQQNALYGGLFLLIVFLGFVYNRFRITRSQKIIIEEQKTEVESAHQQLAEKNKEVIDSINYARRIQSAILPPEKQIKSFFPESFILYRPKDIVAGDFYWFSKKNDSLFLAVCDCTGHGVPGALVSVVCHGALNRAVNEFNLSDPGKILDKTREIVVEEFSKSEEDVKDGMDISLLKFETRSVSGSKFELVNISWAGANNPLWYIENGFIKETEAHSSVGTCVLESSDGRYRLMEVKADKQPIGKTEKPKPFTTYTIAPIPPGSFLFLFTDGYADQFGGPKGKKFKYSNLQKLLLAHFSKDPQNQFQILNSSFDNWKNELEQVDDLCIIGIRT